MILSIALAVREWVKRVLLSLLLNSEVFSVKNTTKLKLILQLYTITFDMDEDENLQLTVIDKRTGEKHTLIHKNYTAVVRKAFVYMNKQMRNPA